MPHGRRSNVWSAARGATDAWLQVLADNQAATALYARLGFAEVDRYEYLVATL